MRARLLDCSRVQRGEAGVRGGRAEARMAPLSCLVHERVCHCCEGDHLNGREVVLRTGRLSRIGRLPDGVGVVAALWSRMAPLPCWCTCGVATAAIWLVDEN